MRYQDFINQPSSEKITLATLEAGKRLMGWTVHFGPVYRLDNFDAPVIVSIEDSGAAYSEVFRVEDLEPGTFFNDRATKTLYIQTVGSDNPNGRFIVLTQRFFFSSAPIVLPHDLDSGEEVFWEPMIANTSQFGVEIDTINQTSDAIEGSGTLTLYNDQEFWPKNFDKLFFENKPVKIYSFNRELEPGDAKLIFQGVVEKKSYNSTNITFSLKDLLSQLRSPVDLGTIADLNARTGSDLAQARQRLILGRVFGHRPVNIDQVLDGYPIQGTVSISFNSATLTGSGTAFLTQLSPDDRIVLDGEEYTIATVTSNTSATLTENYSKPAGLSGAQALLIPDKPKRWMNRIWHVAGHPVREPVTFTEGGSTIIRLIVEDTSDIYPDDWIYVGELGSGDLVQVASVTGAKIINLKSSLATIPAIGTKVTRPAIQNVRINDVLLTYWRDYTFDAETATLTLRNTAEANASPIRHLTSTVSFSSGSRNVTGSGFKGTIQPGYMLGVAGNAEFHEVLSVNSDTSITLRTAPSFTSTANGRYKPLVFDPRSHVLTLDVLGKTEDGTTNGRLLKTAPSIVKGLLKDIKLDGSINEESFQESESQAPMHIGLVVPSSYSDHDTPVYRDVINAVNKSVFGTLVQTGDFKLTYNVLRPKKPLTALRLDESDIISLKYESTSENAVKTVIVEYRPMEYDYLTEESAVRTIQKTSDISNYIIKTTREKTINTNLVDDKDAKIIANRWSFILEHGSGRATIETKLQAINVDVGSVIEISHRKFFERYGMLSRSRLFLVEAVKKSGRSVVLEVVDLSNAFTRVATINSFSNKFQQATESERLYGGYYTDDYGMIDNESETFGLNVIW